MNIELKNVKGRMYDPDVNVDQAEVVVSLDNDRVIGAFQVYIGMDFPRLYICGVNSNLRAGDFVELAAWLAAHEQWLIEEIKRTIERQFRTGGEA